MIRGDDPVPKVRDPSPGYKLRQATLEDHRSYTQTFATTYDDPSPFGDLMKHTIPGGFFVVEHMPTGTVVAASTAAIYKKSQYPEGHSLQWVVAHTDHRATGSGQATVAAATQILADTAPKHSYLTTDDFRIPAISIYLKLGWKPLLFQDDQISRWARVFGILEMPFDEKDWPSSP